MKRNYKIIAMILALASLAWFILTSLVENFLDLKINEPHTKEII